MSLLTSRHVCLHSRQNDVVQFRTTFFHQSRCFNCRRRSNIPSRHRKADDGHTQKNGQTCRDEALKFGQHGHKHNGGNQQQHPAKCLPPKNSQLVQPLSNHSQTAFKNCSGHDCFQTRASPLTQWRGMRENVESSKRRAAPLSLRE